jgi:hypothetical protein
MDEPLFSLFIFVVVVIFYFHLVAQWKKSEDLEIYETDYLSNMQLQEVCSIRQPVLFLFKHPTPIYQYIQFASLEKYPTFSVKIKDMYDYNNPNIDTVDYIELPLNSARRLMVADTTSRYISENNEAFLEETGLSKPLATMNSYLKPSTTLYSRTDVLFGSKHAHTPLRYHTNSEYFVVPIAGKITVKMTPWKSSSYLYPVKDYENYEFWSRVNVWKPDAIHSTEMEKLRFLEFDVLPGHILFIPPYWWYSIQFSGDPNTCVCTFMYDTIINVCANSYDWSLYYLQQNNIYNRITPSEKTIAFDGKSSPSSSETRMASSKDTRTIPQTLELQSSVSNEALTDTSSSRPEVLPEKPNIVTNMGTFSV